MRAKRAFTLLELLIVLAIIAILSAIGFTQLNRDTFQVQQAARSFTTSVQKARYEAVSQNEFAGIRATPAGFQIFRDTDGNRAFTSTTADTIVSTVTLGSGDYPLVTLPAGTDQQIIFTPRGTPFGVPSITLAFRSKNNSNYGYDVKVSAQGRVTMEKKQ